MTHEIKVTLKETSEALGAWVSEEVNELVFISEVIGEFERRLEKEGLTIQKTVHPKQEDRLKAFYVIDLGWFSVMFYHRDWLKNDVVSINVNIKNITSHPNPDGSKNSHTCLTVDMFMKFGEKVKVINHNTHYIASGITYREILGDEKIEEINKVVKVINDMNKNIPDFDKIDINL